ncbi:MAG: FAD-binding oxidoreductase [Rhizobiaceae bacterium]|nr:FAD-binding oxidoreductase [Rhizobiaceae bacterium]
MQIRRLPVETGSAAWNELLEPAAPAVSLASDIVADYLIIGAGFAGLAAARRLTQLDTNARIVVLDALRVGEGAAGRNSGFMIDLPHELSSADYATTLENDRRQIALNRKAIAFSCEACAEYKLSPEVFDECGKYNGAAAEKAHNHNIEYARHLDELGESYRILGADEMRALTGSRFYKSGLFTPGTVLIQPAGFVRGLAHGMSNRISLFENSPVTRLERANGNWLAKTNAGSVLARKVIIATNGHIESFGHFKRQVFHVMLYASMTRALSEHEDAATGEKKWGITPSDPAATTLRKFSGYGGTRIITRNRMSYVPSLSISDNHLNSIAKHHQAAFSKRYPELDHVEQEHVWSGRLCLSRNSAPAFGQLEEGLYAACCQNGLGTTKGTLAGIAAAEFACEGETELVRDMLEQGVPTKLPPAPLDTIGANAFMRWAEFKARREM